MKVTGKTAAKALSKYSIFAILLLPMVWNFESAAVCPALGLIEQAFPNEPYLMITLVSTAPFLTSVIFSMLSGVLTKRFDKRMLAIVGLALYGITGMLPAFSNSIGVILVLRLITGIGAGLILPLPNQMIIEQFDGSRKERMLGLASSTFNFSNVAISIIVGLLLVFGWQMSFLSFSFIFIVLVVAITGLPKSPPAEQVVKRKRQSIPKYAYWMFGAMFFIWLVFGGFALTTSMFALQNNFIPVGLIGLLMALPSVTAIVIGFCFPFLNRKLGRAYVFVTLLCYALGFLCYFFASNAALLVIGALLMGVGTGSMVPYITNLTSLHVSPEQRDSSLGLVTSGIHLGGLCSAFVIGAAMDTVGFRSIYITLAVLLAAVALVSLGVALVRKRSSQPASA